MPRGYLAHDPSCCEDLVPGWRFVPAPCRAPRAIFSNYHRRPANDARQSVPRESTGASGLELARPWHTSSHPAGCPMVPPCPRVPRAASVPIDLSLRVTPNTCKIRPRAPRCLGPVPLGDVMSARIPVSAYRMQFNHRFTLEQAGALIDYLHGLGISDCYASPLTQARPGSVHGYDVTHHGVVNPEVGGEERLGEFPRRRGPQAVGVSRWTAPMPLGVGAAS